MREQYIKMIQCFKFLSSFKTYQNLSRKCLSSFIEMPPDDSLQLINAEPKIHAPFIANFVDRYFWPREPSRVASKVPLGCDYLKNLTWKYATNRYTILALDRDSQELLGLACNSVVCPWTAPFLASKAASCTCPETASRMRFLAHIGEAPGLFRKHKIDHLLELEVLCVSERAGRRGVGKRLTVMAVNQALQMGYPLIRVDCTSLYTAKIMEDLDMKKEWVIAYDEYEDAKKGKIFTPQPPHTHVMVYTKKGWPLM